MQQYLESRRGFCVEKPKIKNKDEKWASRNSRNEGCSIVWTLEWREHRVKKLNKGLLQAKQQRQNSDMDMSSWFRRVLLKDCNKLSDAPHFPKQHSKGADARTDEELLGLTQHLIDFVRSFTVETFKNFPLQDDEEAGCDSPTSSGKDRKDLSDWQEQHATLMLSKIKEISRLRYILCPRHLKERQFWRIYFCLVKSHVAPCELQAVRLAKLKSMAAGNEQATDASACEVEMAEARQVNE